LHYSKEKHKSEEGPKEAQRGGARKAKTARTEYDEDYVNTRSANIEDRRSPMEGAPLAKARALMQLWSASYFGISSMQR
jgi:hypothetical protein